jgi:hypothetical protein
VDSWDEERWVLTAPDASSGAGLRDDGAVRRRVVRTWGAGAVAALVLAGVTGCATGSDPSPSTGVDELVVPTPSPDPADFVDGVDNPWFVLDEATYSVGVGATATPVERAISDGPDVTGVATTAVTLDGATDLYAQDAAGNVWWFGHRAPDGVWQAGTDGAEAGLVMAARPRSGDGYRRAEVPGRELRSTVVSVDRTTVVVEDVTDGEVTRSTYTNGAGLELVEADTGVVVLARQQEGE